MKTRYVYKFMKTNNINSSTLFIHMHSYVFVCKLAFSFFSPQYALELIK